MINAKEELLAHLGGKDVVKCAWFADYDADYGFVEGVNGSCGRITPRRMGKPNGRT